MRRQMMVKTNKVCRPDYAAFHSWVNANRVCRAERQEKDKQFNLLTEAAGELMSLGFEDIYQESKSDIAANLNK